MSRDHKRRWDENSFTAVTTPDYDDNRSRLWRIVTNEYSTSGELKRTSGSRTYRLEYAMTRKDALRSEVGAKGLQGSERGQSLVLTDFLKGDHVEA